MTNLINNLSEEAKVRLAFIEFYQKVNEVSLVCKTFNISRPTFYKWLRRYDPNNLLTLEDESKAPVQRRKTLLTAQKEKRIKKIRMENLALGKDKLKPLYEKEFGEPVSKHHIQYVIQKYNLYPPSRSNRMFGMAENIVGRDKHEDNEIQQEVHSVSGSESKKLFPMAEVKIFIKRALIGVVVIALLYVGIFYSYSTYTNLKRNESVLSINSGNSSTQNTNSDQELVSKVGRLIDLPAGEDPTIATVTDKTQLDEHQFFSSAKNGDKILLYRVAKIAILYDPSANKIISTAPIDLGE